MKKVLSLLLCCALVLCIGSASGESDVPLRTIQDDERMMFEGKDLFAYTSGELYTLQHDLGLYDPETIGYVGYALQDPDEDAVPGLAFAFDGFLVATQSDDPEALQNKAALIALPLEQTAYRVTYVRNLESGVPGPFGIEVGTPVDTLFESLPEMPTHPKTLRETGQDYSLAMQYQDDAGDVPVLYWLRVYCAGDNDTVVFWEVMRE